jgi:integrase
MTRTVPMTDEIVEALHQQRQYLMKTQNVGLQSGIVFPSEVGTRRTASAFHDPCQKVADKLGLDVKVGPQVLRKTVNTLLGQDGWTRAAIKSLTGHETDQMLDHYTEPRTSDLRESLEETLGGRTG